MVALALGLLFAPLASAATSGVPFSQAGLASGVLNTSRQVGGSLGLAALATVAIDRTKSVHNVSRATALTDGYARAYFVAMFVAVAALACSFIVPASRRVTRPRESDNPINEESSAPSGTARGIAC